MPSGLRRGCLLAGLYARGIFKRPTFLQSRSDLVKIRSVSAVSLDPSTILVGVLDGQQDPAFKNVKPAAYPRPNIMYLRVC